MPAAPDTLHNCRPASAAKHFCLIPAPRDLRRAPNCPRTPSDARSIAWWRSPCTSAKAHPVCACVHGSLIRSAPLERAAQGVADVTRITSFETSIDVGPDRIDCQRHGADRAWRVPLADVLHPVRVRRADGGAGHVVRHLRRRAAVPRHGDRLRRAVEALSRRRLLVLLRRAGVSVEDEGRPSGSRASRSSPSAGPATCTTGAIRG